MSCKVDLVERSCGEDEERGEEEVEESQFAKDGGRDDETGGRGAHLGDS